MYMHDFSCSVIKQNRNFIKILKTKTVILVYTEEITDNYCIFKDLLTIVDLMVVNLVWILMTIDSQLMLANLQIH